MSDFRRDCLLALDSVERVTAETVRKINETDRPGRVTTLLERLDRLEVGRATLMDLVTRSGSADAI